MLNLCSLLRIYSQKLKNYEKYSMLCALPENRWDHLKIINFMWDNCEHHNVWPLVHVGDNKKQKVRFWLNICWFEMEIGTKQKFISFDSIEYGQLRELRDFISKCWPQMKYDEKHFECFQFISNISISLCLHFNIWLHIFHVLKALNTSLKFIFKAHSIVIGAHLFCPIETIQ